MQPFVSIIIPTYNRAHLIGESLDSIIAQSYNNWECIVVDDCSTDNTDELMEFYCRREPRIHYQHRPTDWTKGANSCRNYGFSKSKGKYIQWFDSDDIMLPRALAIKVSLIEDIKCDFVIGKLTNFSIITGEIQQYYNRTNPKINIEEFLFRRINWMTPDPLIRKQILQDNNIGFNEIMSSDQEYNYYCKILSRTTNGVYIDEILTRRRIHSDSIQNKIDRSSRIYLKELYKNRILTFKDIEGNLRQRTKQEYLNQIMTIYFDSVGAKLIFRPQGLFAIILKHKGIRSSVFYFLSLISNYFIGKGYWLLQKAKAK